MTVIRQTISKESELVLDPFMGSGTTGRVCDKLRRNFVGYDKKVNGWESLDINGDIIPERISDFIYHFNKDKLYISRGYVFD